MPRGWSFRVPAGGRLLVQDPHPRRHHQRPPPRRVGSDWPVLLQTEHLPPGRLRHGPEGDHHRRDVLLVHRPLGQAHRHLQRGGLQNVLRRILEGELEVVPHHLRPAGRIHQVPVLGEYSKERSILSSV